MRRILLNEASMLALIKALIGIEGTVMIRFTAKTRISKTFHPQRSYCDCDIQDSDIKKVDLMNEL